jgi:small subunit ribosomal protein S3
MTHTVHPYAHRLGIIRDWKSRWFGAGVRQYRENFKIDTALRTYLKKRLRGLYVTTVEIERGEKEIRLIIKTSRPGMVIGRSGEGTQQLKNDIQKMLGKLRLEETLGVKIDVEEVRSPESNAAVVAYMIAEGLEKRMPHRRVLKQTVEKVMANRDVKGVRIRVAGRLGGAEMSRKEEIKKGRIPLQTFRADIDYCKEQAYLPYGVIGVKVWIYRGEVFNEQSSSKI